MAELTDDRRIREVVRERYAAAAAPRRESASARASGEGGSECCGAARSPAAARAACSAAACTTTRLAPTRPTAAVEASLGCGVPTAVADLHEGETVLDLGSGAGADVLISARRVGPTGRAIGLDMTDEMLELARANAARRGRRERRVRQGLYRGASAARRVGRRRHLQLRDQPLGRQAARAARGGAGAAARRAFRGLRRDRRRGHGRRDPRGHGRMDRLHRRRAHPRRVRGALSDAGLVDVEVIETHRVHEHAASAIIRARTSRDRRSRSTRRSSSSSRWEREPWSSQEVDLSADRASWEAMRGDRARCRSVGALVADRRRGADHDPVHRPRAGRRRRGGDGLPRQPAGRRGPPPPVLRALPGRGHRRSRRDRGPRGPARGSTSATPSGASSTRRSSRPTSGSSRTRATAAPRSSS